MSTGTQPPKKPPHMSVTVYVDAAKYAAMRKVAMARNVAVSTVFNELITRHLAEVAGG